MIISTFAHHSQVCEVNISKSFEIDMERKHTSVSSIVINSNALKMLDITINDLSQAEILGKCRITVSIGSDQIPCYNRIDHEIKVKSFKDAFNL